MLMEPVKAPACWWPCACLKCVSGLRIVGQTWNFWDAYMYFYLVLKYCSDINDGNWLQLFYYLIVLIDIAASVFAWILFHLCFRNQVWVFSYCSVTEGFEIGFPKCFDHDWVLFGMFLWNMPCFVDFISAWTEICMKWAVVILFRRHQTFSIVSLSGILACFLYMLQLFSSRIL